MLTAGSWLIRLRERSTIRMWRLVIFIRMNLIGFDQYLRSVQCTVIEHQGSCHCGRLLKKDGRIAICAFVVDAFYPI